MRKVAVIPVKEKSDRVDNKNFKIFADNCSLLELKIKQLLAANCFDAIYISSNSDKAKSLAIEYQVQYIERSDSYCNNIISWSDVIHYVISSLPEESDTVIAWCHTTSPLFSGFTEAMQKFMDLIKGNSEFDSLTTVTPFSEFLLNEKSRPYNYNWGIWHDYSQNLEKLYKLTGALFIALKSEMIKNRYVMSKKPYLYLTSPIEAIDIDTTYDLKLAQLIYNNINFFDDVK